MCLSSSGAREHQLIGKIVNIQGSTNPPGSPIMRHSGIRKFGLQFVYKVCHKNPQKSRAKSTTLRNHPHDVNTAILGDPWVEDTNFDHVEPFSGVFPHPSYDVLFIEYWKEFPSVDAWKRGREIIDGKR